MSVRSLLLALALTLTVSAPAYAEAEREIVAGALRHWPPDYRLDEDGQPSGFAVEIMEVVARRAGLQVRFKTFETFTEMIAALDEGAIDVIPTLGITAARGERFAFTPPVETHVMAVFVRADGSAHELADLRGKPVAAVVTNAAVDILPQHGIEPVIHPDLPSALFELLAGRVDALAYPAEVTEALARDAGVADRIVRVGAPLREIKRAMAVRAADEALHAALSKGVDDLGAGEEYRAIYRRWYGAEPGFWSVSRALWLAALLLGGLFLATAFARFRLLSRHNRELRARIDERDGAQAALAESEAKYRLMVETAAEGVWLIDAEAVTTFVNRRMAEMLGRTPEDMLGRSMYEFFPSELAAQAQRNMDRRRTGVVEHHDFRLRRADGSEVAVTMAASPFSDGGAFRGALAMVSDVTDRRRLEAQLLRAQRLEAVGRLAGGIAHDFNNLLVVIGACNHLARETLERGHPAAADLAQVDEACERASALTSSLLAFARQQVTRPETFSAAERLTASSTLLARLIGEDVQLTVSAATSATPGDAAPPTCRIHMDPSQFDQLLLNLAANARDAMPEGGLLTIALTEEQYEGNVELEAGWYVVLTCEDTGVGMSEEVAAHVFEPFFTTKAEGTGTGLGLATCYGIVTGVGGEIAVERLETGTRFTVRIPRQQDSAAVSPIAAPRQSTSSALLRTVLLVEDDPQVAAAVKRLLERRGLEVLATATAAEALAACRERDGAFDLVLTDLVMPGMNGRELGRSARASYPSLRVLYMSGYSDRALVSAEDLEDGEAFIAKPIAPAELWRAIDELARTPDGQHGSTGSPPSATP